MSSRPLWVPGPLVMEAAGSLQVSCGQGFDIGCHTIFSLEVRPLY